MLIGFGKELAEAVQRRAGQPLFVTATMPFGTIDPLAILARIACGLRRAAALETRLTAYAARGRDLPPPRAEAPPRPPQPAPSPERKPPSPRPRPAVRPDPDGFPTVAEIVAQARRRPIGAVIADICRDLGLVPGQCDHAFWQELSDIITTYGGKIGGWIKTLDRRIWQSLRLAKIQQDMAPATFAPQAPPPDAVATGPPPRPGLRTVPA
jgi:hypothetical protein